MPIDVDIKNAAFLANNFTVIYMDSVRRDLFHRVWAITDFDWDDILLADPAELLTVSNTSRAGVSGGPI